MKRSCIALRLGCRVIAGWREGEVGSRTSKKRGAGGRLPVRLLAPAACIVLASCGSSTNEVVLPSPDGNVVLVHGTAMGGGAAGYVGYGVDFKGPGKDNRIGLGSAAYPGKGMIFWRDNTTVNVCGFKSDPPQNIFKVLGYDQKIRTYRVTSDCPPDEDVVSNEENITRETESSTSSAEGSQ